MLFTSRELPLGNLVSRDLDIVCYKACSIIIYSVFDILDLGFRTWENEAVYQSVSVTSWFIDLLHCMCDRYIILLCKLFCSVYL